MNNLLFIVLFCIIIGTQSRTYPSRFMAQDEGEIEDTQIDEAQMKKLEKEEQQLQKTNEKPQQELRQIVEQVQNDPRQNNQTYEAKDVGQINLSNLNELRNKKTYEQFDQNAQNYQDYLKKQQDDAAKNQEVEQTVTIDSVIPDNYAFLRTNYKKSQQSLVKKPQQQQQPKNEPQQQQQQSSLNLNAIEQNQAKPQYDYDLTKQDQAKQFNTSEFFEDETLEQNRRTFQENVMEHPGDYPQETIDQVASELQVAKAQQDYNQQDPQNLTPNETSQFQQPPQFEQNNELSEEIDISPRFMKKHHKITKFHKIKAHHNFDKRRLRKRL